MQIRCIIFISKDSVPISFCYYKSTKETMKDVYRTSQTGADMLFMFLNVARPIDMENA